MLKGKVVGFKPFGAFVDLGGLEGMLHVSELGHSRVAKPEDVLSMGQEIEVQVLKIEPGEKGQRIALSLKSLATDPWQEAAAAFTVGQRVKGKVTRLMAFGAFVEIAPGTEGLVHISELGAGRRINHPKEVVSPGQAVVTLINPDELWVRADVEETYVDRIRVGDHLTVRLPSGHTRDGVVFYRAADANFATQRDVSRTKRDIKTFQLRVRCDNHDRALAVGMTAYVALALSPR